MAMKYFDSYIIRVSATQSDGLRLTVGFMIDADAFDALKDTHDFQVTDSERFLFCSDEEFYRIQEIIKTHYNKEKP